MRAEPKAKAKGKAKPRARSKAKAKAKATAREEIGHIYHHDLDFDKSGFIFDKMKDKGF